MRVAVTALFFITLGIPSVFAQGYKVGERGPAGGLIFDVAGNDVRGWRYVEAAPENEESSIWSNVEEELGTTKARFGSGATNTKAIVGQKGHTESAAKACDDLTARHEGRAFEDWFLPSLTELQLMHVILKVGEFEEFGAYPYWSSTESHVYLPGSGEEVIRPAAFDFSRGKVLHSLTKGERAAVRCIRKF